MGKPRADEYKKQLKKSLDAARTPENSEEMDRLLEESMRELDDALDAMTDDDWDAMQNMNEASGSLGDGNE